MTEDSKAAIIVIAIIVILCFFAFHEKNPNRNWDNYESDYCEVYNC